MDATKNGQWYTAWQQRLPGLLLLLALSGVLTIALPDGIWLLSSIAVALISGLLIRNTIGVNPALKPGIDYTVKSLLKAAIILLGLRFSFQQVLQLGLGGLVLILVCIAGAALATFVMAKVMKITPKLAVLIGVGTAICGNSAIMATSPVIQADEEEVAIAVSTITLFGTLAVILYPLIGTALGLGSQAFGFWSGTAINDTSQVVAAAFAFSREAGDIGTLVKITRNILMGPAIVLIGLMFAASDGSGKKVSMAKVFPWFVLGFVALAALNSFGWVPGNLKSAAQNVSVFIIQMVLIGVGLNTDLRKIFKVGARGFVVGLSAAIMISLFSLTTIYLAQDWLFGLL